MNIIDKIKNHDWYVFTDIMTVIGPALLFILLALLTSCSTIKYVPIEQEEKIIIKDSVVYITDSIWIEVPVEKIVQVLPQDTTSILRTSVAQSEAKIEKGMLHHTLEQKGVIKTQIDTFYITQIKEVEKVVEVPVEVVKEVKYIPNWCWWVLVYAVILTLLIGFRIYLKYCQPRL